MHNGSAAHFAIGSNPVILTLALLLAVIAWICNAVARALDASLEEADRHANISR